MSQRGQTSVEYLGALVVVAVVIGVVSSTGLGGKVAGHAEALICRVAGGDCATAEGADGPQGARTQQGPDSGPAIGSGAPVEVLPFPGSATVTCSVPPRDDGAPGSNTKTKTCQSAGGSGPKLQPSGEVTVERSPTKLNGRGCPQQTVSISTKFKLEASTPVTEGGKDSPLKGVLKAVTGAQSKYAVTVNSDRAESISQGEGTLPNPVDPTTLGPGESIQLSHEFYSGLGLDGQYGALQAQLGYDSGRRVSSGVTRRADGSVRIFVGDEQFVRDALALGVGGGDFKVSGSVARELADGKLRAVDIDIRTPEGWNAYQQFIATGHLPADGAAGTSNPTRSETLKYTNAAKIEGKLGNLSLGAQLQDAEANVAVTHNADGSTSESFDIRYRDLGLEVTDQRDADGNRTRERTYALNLEGVDPDVYSNFAEATNRDPTPPEDGNLRMEFTSADLTGIRNQALEAIAYQMEQWGVKPRPSAQDVADNLERNNGQIKYGPHDTVFNPQPPTIESLANAETPDDMIETLYRLGGGDPNHLLTGPLTDLILASLQANDGKLTGLPGTLTGGRCGA